jgi:hypothetical protein
VRMRSLSTSAFGQPSETKEMRGAGRCSGWTMSVTAVDCHGGVRGATSPGADDYFLTIIRLKNEEGISLFGLPIERFRGRTRVSDLIFWKIVIENLSRRSRWLIQAFLASLYSLFNPFLI